MSLVIHCDTARFVYEVLEKGEYSFLFDNLVVIDAGANIGTFSMWIYPHASKIHAVEMDQRNIELLQRNVADNNLERVKIYKERLLDLAGFMSNHTIPFVDVLKLDIEGDEIELLARKDFPVDKIKTIIGEYHGVPVKDRLETLGYHYYELPNNHFIARL